MQNLAIAPTPHIRKGISTQKVMMQVIIALMPTLIASGIIFGLRAILLTVICATSCVVFEYIFCLITKKPNTTSDLSAIVTGILLAFNLPVTLPIYMAVIGCFIAIVIVKLLFGGIGQNFANPAITARIALMLSFSTHMTVWVEPFYYKSVGFFPSSQQIDSVSGATAIVAEGGELPRLMDMLWGVRTGSLGETCAVALILGGIYLMVVKVIKPIIPVTFIGTMAVLSLISGQDVPYQLLSGGLILAAFFMATDYSTSPITNRGKIVFAVGCGVISFVIRTYASLPEGVSFAILFMNIMTPYIDRWTTPTPLGVSKEDSHE